MVDAGLFSPPALTPDYGDPIAEARACRTACALFDFSFLARGRLAGPGAAAGLNALTGRRVESLKVGRIAYALRSTEGGWLVADLTVWRTGPEEFELMSGRREDVRDIAQVSDAEFLDMTDSTAIFALQGPGTLSALLHLGAGSDLRAIPYFGHAEARLAGIDCRIGRLGYTGEAGVEVVTSSEASEHLWSSLCTVAPRAGFAAADILRIEAGFPLFWNDFAMPVTAAEAGLESFAVGDPAAQPELWRICFVADCDFTPVMWRPDPIPERPSQPGVVAVTSACWSPQAGGVLGIGYVRRDTLEKGSDLRDTGGRFRHVRRVHLPFYDRAKRRPRSCW